MLDLFSGIGGFSLAGRWAGFTTAQFVEIDPFCQKVLSKNFPGVPIHADVKSFRGERLRGSIDLLTGGFPCQPYSVAGKQRGAADDRAIWPQMLRVIGEVRPAWVVGENVANFVNMGLDGCVSDMESIGYTCRSFVIPACGVQAPHRRDRVWIVAADADEQHRRRKSQQPVCGGEAPRNQSVGRTEPAADAGCSRREEQRIAFGIPEELTEFSRSIWREINPLVRRGDDGLPGGLDKDRVSRLKSLGNAIVPQVVLPILQAIHSELTTEGRSN